MISALSSSSIATNRVRTKICGVTTAADAQAAAAAGADAIGLVFAAGSSRAISIARAGEITAALPPFVARVALFMDNEARLVEQVLASLPIDLLQFHGSESAAFCASFDTPFAKAVPMGEPGVRLVEWAERYDRAAALLLDANRVGQAGGQGETFDWQAKLESVAQPIIIAGGLNPDNVSEAIACFSPYAVDVSSGVERERGAKCSAKMKAFVDAVNQAGRA
ncbi:phosphoribosylanthranilate isomerase [Salinisphaera sp. SPP-AMP-43]|uniref:phosphoribosylanthranilate isomerase n=1 Tax=Salinisphaera sp. SPP-AMP-43 TaxID=3121288 RepID=UPI003C6E5C54